MANIKFSKTYGEPSSSDKDALVQGLLSHHASAGHPRKTETFSVFVHDQNKPIGGIIVSFLWNGMHIDSLWVHEDFRGEGIGKQLMEHVENEAKKRSCKLAYTDTFTWQALGFYKKMGYSVYGELDDFPPGNSLSYIQKRL